jgi:hypothetical protein
LLKQIAPEKTYKFWMIKDFIARRNFGPLKLQNSEFLSVELSRLSFVEEPELDLKHTFKVSVELKRFMDEKLINEQAVDLNVKLMKWRIKSELDIQRIQDQKVLLFGAGTLGCQVARNLVGWGMRHINFIDYGTVQHSNPVRQSLYVYDDCLEGGKPKAEAAAAS